MITKAGEIYCVYNKFLKKYTACQVTKIDDSGKNPQAVILSLDWFGDKLPKLDEFAAVRPLYIDYMYWNRSLYLKKVDISVPPNYVYIGNLTPLNNDDTDIYGSWSNGHEVHNQFIWEKIPKDQRDTFKKANLSDEFVEFEGKRRRIRTHNENDKWHDFDDALHLRVFPCLSSLTVTKWHKNLFEYLNANPFIREFIIENHGKSKLDFSKTSIHRLSVDMTGLDELVLNKDLNMLSLTGQVKECCKIKAHDGGKYLILNCEGTVPKLDGLEELNALHVTAVTKLDVDAIATVYPKLKELRLWGKPGKIINFGKLSKFSELEVLTTMDVFGFTAREVPRPDDLKKLYRLWMDSLPEDAAKEVKKLYKKRKDVGLDLWITKPRKEEWLAQNLDNPFRSWDGDENIPQGMAKKAATIYRKTRSAMVKLIADPDNDLIKEIETLVREYTVGFNKMDKRKNFIYTTERDEIFQALEKILNLIPDELSVNRDELINVFDEIKEF
ncbi:gliding motility protein [Mogibacterium pumilum]|uniref:Gliding motility protein n=1 Tax=Mogibacterium pumilum TaxID=86332 RepID=A0A223ASP6_9FIRM|nr:gliding motility protein [Mogibacterium pumilum]ASS37935.1 gliding motility protein [Mogibacterium pumilum]